ncbi:LOW QUALITY PROTEIN: UDP-glycosyltransferase 89B2-like [Curcuma longa]|uniref:LOW QUALITY PROTEIN: UDP-glycosyltransferase 89B2-like n=1 Tax=Curcuma longa TaxID=136217 RepID=UPI003D9F53D9
MAAERRVHLLLVPFPAAGHILPLLDLARLLSESFHPAVIVTVAVTPKNVSLLAARCPAASPLVLPFPSDPAIPPGIENAHEDPCPDVRLLIRAFAGLHLPLLRWAKDHRPTALLSDFFCGFTHSLAAELGVPRLVFSPSRALCLSLFHSLWRRMPKRNDPNDAVELILFPDLPGSPLYPWRHLNSTYRRYVEGDPLSEFVKEMYLANTRSWGFVFNTFAELERTYLHHLRRDLGHARVWAVGPVAPPVPGTSIGLDERLAGWLAESPDGSVVYVAFGSMAELSPAQAEALAAGLERSRARFVWATRGAVAMPVGFEDRVAGRGLVLAGWAPQVAILNHAAVGAFISHCGWNSVLEAVAAGVSLLTWPMTADQFFNARLLEEEIGTGLRACEGGEEAVPEPDELARLVAEAVGEAGRAQREKARELGRKAVEAVSEGGSSARDLADLVDQLSKVSIDQTVAEQTG